MKRMAILLVAALAALPVVSFAAGKSIYGSDNRRDFYELSDAKKAMADSVVAIWPVNRMATLAEEPKVQLSTRSLNLCPSEKFQEQRAGALCSGALVGDDLVMTAGHCLRDDKINTRMGMTCEDMRFVFGFAVKSSTGGAPDRVDSSEVYSCKSAVLHSFSTSTLSDYALIRLDRRVTGHRTLGVNRHGSPEAGAKLFVMGYPSGLPLKEAGDASVRSTGTAVFFVTNLDTFQGNSGSPVFNESTGLIEGILVRGDEDYESTAAGCYTAATYPQDSGRGEDVTKLQPLLPYIPGGSGSFRPAGMREMHSSPAMRRLMEMAPIDPNDPMFW